MSHNGTNHISTENFVALYLNKRLYNDDFAKDLDLCIKYTKWDSGAKLKKLLEISSPEITQKLQEYNINWQLNDVLYKWKIAIRELFGDTVEIRGI